MRQISRLTFLSILFAVAPIALANPGLAQEAVPIAPEIPTTAIPTVETDQLFQEIPTAPAIEAVPVPEVVNIVTPEIPTTEFPEVEPGTAPLNSPTLTPIPFAAPQLTAPQFTRPVLAAPALAAPALSAPALVGFQGTPPQFAGPTLNAPGFNPPNLAGPSLNAPTLNFLSAPEPEAGIENTSIPDIVPPETVTPFGN